MAMYYQGSSEIQADGLQTLYLMNPNYVGYSDSLSVQKSSNMVLCDTEQAVNSTAQISHAPPLLPHHFVGIPLSAASVGTPNSQYSSNPVSVLSQQEFQPSMSRFHQSQWKSVGEAAGGGNRPDLSSSMLPATNSVGADQDGAFRRPAQQGLSLSLPSVQSSIGMISSKPASSNGVNNLQSVILGSKYLKAAQQLLDELVVVGKDTKAEGVVAGAGAMEKPKIPRESAGVNIEAFSNKGYDTELSNAQRQEIQMKKAKLINMLEEVDLRYRQYHQQMQIVVASFEVAAGIRSARSYTQLALKTIAKQFRCLRDAISTQIKAISKSLGEAGQNSGEKFEGSRLKFVDHQFRQQRALQQFGMIQNTAWRPQRGLPERAVSVLRAWLFENFLHPYPKDSDKHMLAKQTGLSRSQVSNWFINARVRLWKPMVEEMYLEEMKNQEPNENTISSEQNNKGKIEEMLQEKNLKKPRSGQYQINSPTSKIPMQTETKSGSDHQITGKGFDDKFSSERLQAGDHNYLTLMAANTNPGNGFNTYAIEELGRFNGSEQLGTRFHGNNVFLTLGLPPSENSKMGTRIETRAVENNYNRVNNLQESHPNIGYHEIVDFQNRKPFPAQLLSDFVA